MMDTPALEDQKAIDAAAAIDGCARFFVSTALVLMFFTLYMLVYVILFLNEKVGLSCGIEIYLLCVGMALKTRTEWAYRHTMKILKWMIFIGFFGAIWNAFFLAVMLMPEHFGDFGDQMTKTAPVELMVPIGITVVVMFPIMGWLALKHQRRMKTVDPKLFHKTSWWKQIPLPTIALSAVYLCVVLTGMYMVMRTPEFLKEMRFEPPTPLTAVDIGGASDWKAFVMAVESTLISDQVRYADGEAWPFDLPQKTMTFDVSKPDGKWPLESVLLQWNMRNDLFLGFHTCDEAFWHTWKDKDGLPDPEPWPTDAYAELISVDDGPYHTFKLPESRYLVVSSKAIRESDKLFAEQILSLCQQHLDPISK